MLIAIDRFIQAHRRRLLAAVAVAAVACALVAAHSAMRADHMGMGTAMCLAVAEVAAVAAMTVLTGRHRPSVALPRRVPALRPFSSLPRARPLARGRAGPPVLQVFRL